MATNTSSATANYGLSQYGANDPVKFLTNYNQDMAAIDAALKNIHDSADGKTPLTRSIAGLALSADITLAQLIATGLAAGTNGQANDSAKLAGVDATKFPQISSGTWTPTLYGATTAGMITYTVRGGTYYKNGKLVLLLGHIEWSALSGGAGEIHIGGLPFAHNAAQSALLNLSSESITNATSFGDINAEIRAGADSINLWPMANALNFDSLATGGWLSVAGLYLTNE